MDANGNKLRVLVVDDNRDAADSLAMLVKLWGHDVEIGYDGTAINRVPVFNPDVVLLDIGLPKLDGNRFTQEIRRQPEFLSTLIIAVTGFHDEARRVLSHAAGIDHYLIKPVDPGVLKKLLQVKLLEKNSATSSPAAAATEKTP